MKKEPKYRLLNEGEIILATDEAFKGCEWVPAKDRIGEPAPPSSERSTHWIYRRQLGASFTKTGKPK